MGLVLSIQKQYDDAIEKFKMAVEIYPDFAKAYNNMGIAYKHKGNYDKAMAAFEKAVEIDPKFFPAKKNLRKIWRLPDVKMDEDVQKEKLLAMADTYFNQGKLDEALKSYEKILEQDKNNVGVQSKVSEIRKKQKYQKWYNKGFQEMQEGEWKKSYESFAKAIKATDDSIEKDNIVALQREVEFRLKKESFIKEIQNLYLEGLKLYKQKNWKDALDIYNRIFAMDSNFRDVKAKINECKVAYLFKKGKESIVGEQVFEAKTFFSKVLKLFPNHVGAKEELIKIENEIKGEKIAKELARANQRFKEKQYPAAKAFYNSVLSMDKNNKEALNSLRKIEDMNQEKKLKSTFSKITVNFFIVTIVILIYFLFSKLPQIMKVREYYQQYKDLDKAKSMYEEILKKEPSRRVIYHPLARIYKELRQKDKITSIIDIARSKIAEADSSEIPLWYACLGDLFREDGNLREAMIDFEKAYILLPDNDDIQKKLLTVYEDILLEGREDAEVRFKLAELYKRQGKLDMAIAEFELVSHDEHFGERAKTLLAECLTPVKRE